MSVTQRTVDTYKGRGQIMLRKAPQIVIRAPGDLKKADLFVGRCREFEKAVHAKMDPTIRSAKELHTKLLGWRAEALGPVEQARKVVEGVISAYVLTQRKKAEAAQAKKVSQAATATRGGRGGAVPLVPATRPVEPTSVKVYERLDFRITDESKLPRRFLKPDEVKIRKEVNSLREAARIPGVEIFKQAVTAGR